MLSFLSGREAGVGPVISSDLVASTDLATGTGREPAVGRFAGAPLSRGAFLPSVIATVQPCPGKGTFPAPRRGLRAQASWQRQRTVQSQAMSPCRTFAQPDLSKQYPHMTRIAAGNGDAKGPHPARDPV
jgi:hypothetical protein